MTPDQYVQDAIRTESQVEKIQANQVFVTLIINSIVSLSNILDQVKKNAFYGKKFDPIAISTALHTVRTNSEYLIASTYTNQPHPIENKTDLNIDTRLFHAIVGIATESSELLEALRFDGSAMDGVNIQEEFGDLNWYQAIGIDATGGSFEQVLERNIAKLRARYPNKFTSEAAINRDLDTERKILEGQS